MPLFLEKANGNYTIEAALLNTECDYLHLVDNRTGNDIDLLETPSYSFEAKTSDYASRFKLVFNLEGNNNGNDGDNAFAYVDAGGNIVINGEGTLQVIDVTGRVIVSRDGVHTVSTNGMVPGMYILRLINGENVMTQKIVIE